MSLTRPPEVHSATVDGTSLVVIFDQYLAPASSLANGAFEVKKAPAGGTEQTVTLSSTDAPSISGPSVTLTLDSAVTNTDTGVKVSYARPASGSDNKLENARGQEVASFTGRAVRNLRRWAGSPVLDVEVDEGDSATFQWTPPGTPTTESPVKLFILQRDSSGPAISIQSGSQTLTSKTAATFRISGVEDDNWEDEVVHLTIVAQRGTGLARRIGWVNVTVRDDDPVDPGETGGCAAAASGSFWSACLLVAGDHRGYEGLRRGSTSNGFGALSKTTVSRGGTHVIDGIVETGSGRGLSVSFAADPRPAPNSWVVKLGSETFNFSDAKYYHSPRRGALRVSYTHSYHWSEGLSWADGDKVTVSLFDIAKPTGVTAAPGDRQATLSWTAPSAVTPTGYEIRVCKGATADCPEYMPHGPQPPYGGPFSTGGTATSGTVTKYLDVPTGAELVNGVTYTAQVRAVTANGKGGWSDRLEFVPTGNTQVLAPAPPHIVGVTPGGREATLTWGMREAVAGITAWQLRYGEANVRNATVGWSEWADIAEAGADARSHTVTGLTEGAAYAFQLRAMVGALEGTASAAHFMMGVLPEVTGLSATPGDGAVALRWTVPSVTGEIAGWQVRWKAADAASWGEWTDIADATSATAAHTVTGLDNETRYALRVRAITTNKMPLAESGTVEAWAGGPPPPGAPALRTEAGDGQVALTWKVPESAEPITAWQLRHGATAGDDAEPEWGEWTDIEGATGETTTHTVTGLDNGTEYAFELRALAGALVGEASARQLARPEEEEIAPIADLAASEVTATTVGLTWTLPEGAAVTRLRAMRRGLEEWGEWQEWREAAELAVDATSWTVTGLSPMSRYQFRILLDTATQSTDSGLLQLETLPLEPLDTRMAGSVAESDDGTVREGTPAEGCRVDVEVRFLDAGGNAVAVNGLAATDFTVENGRVGTPVAAADGLSWTVPAEATPGFTGLMRVRLAATARWKAAEQAFRVGGSGSCAAAARGDLASLALDGITLSPAFDAGTAAYTAQAPADKAQATVTARAVYGSAAVAIAPADADADADGHQVALGAGETEVTVTVTPADGSDAGTYTVTVTRAADTAVRSTGSATQVPAGWGLIPSGLSSGDRFRLLAVTSTKRRAQASGIGDYDAHVRTAVASGHADIRGHGAAFRTLGCTRDVDARANTGTGYTSADKGVPVYWLGGEKVADDYADLYDGSWDSAAPRDESGARSSHAKAFTGCNADGTVGDPLGARWVDVGYPGTSGRQLHHGGRTLRSMLRPLYALSPVFEVAPAAALDTAMSGSVPRGKSPDREPGDGCRLEVSVAFLDEDGEAVAVDGLAAADFEVANGRIGTPVADEDGLGWTAPAWAASGFTGLVRVRLTAAERREAAEQVFRAASDTDCVPVARNELASLALDGLTLAPSFDAGTTAYTAGAAADKAQATVTAAAVYGAAAVAIAPEDADAEADGHQVALAEGETKVTVTVTPADEDVAAKTWTVTVTRAADTAVRSSGSAMQVPADWGLIPSGLSSGDRFRLLVVTSTKRQATAGGIGGYNTHVQTAVASGHEDIRGHGAAFRMLGCTRDVDARANTGTDFTSTDKGVPVYWLGGGKVADDYGDLYDGVWDSNNPTDENGEQGHPKVWSGCLADGTTGDALGVHWIDVGYPGLSGRELHHRGHTQNLMYRPLYGLSPVFEVAPAVSGAAALSVADAQAEEGVDATLDFAVTLDPASSGTVTVEYATSDGTATAGDDYTATSGTLTFAPGETEKTVSVPVLDDDVDEGSETLTLTLSSPSGATIADGEATGTITNDDLVPQAWLARFGRTVTGQVLDAVEARLAAPREAGARMALAGQALPSWRGRDAAVAGDGAASEAATPADAEDRAALASMTAWLAQTGPDGRGTSGLGGYGDDRGLEPQSHALTERDFIAGTSFALTGGSAEDGGFAALWGRASIAGFDGREGALTVDGEVTTGLIGADWATPDWTAGLAIGHSTGTGGWRRGGECDLNCGGAIEATLSGVYPYAGVNLTERLTVWAAAGHGSGEVTVTPEAPGGGSGAGMTADLTLTMGAAGMRSEVLRPEGGEGLVLALKGDGRFTRTSSDAVRSEHGNLEAADADVWLVRAGIEGSRRFALDRADEGASVTPLFELAVRRDGGDAETGMGADMGGGLVFADPANGLAFDAQARALVAHEADGFREWGAALSFGWDPSPGTGRGLSLSLTQSWGASASGGMEALLSHETLAGLAPADGEEGGDGFVASSRLEGEIGYGLAMFGGAVTGTPNVGFGLSESARDWRIGWRLAPEGAAGFEMNLDATRSEPANDADPPVHGVMLRGAMRW